jgi:hypothetical protein
MRPKLLKDNGHKASCAFLGIALVSLLTPTLWASNNPPLGRPSGVAIHRVNETLVVAEQTIKGSITDESSSGIPGVNVLEKGTSNGVVSDKDGKYSINVKDGNSVLVFSFIGYVTLEIFV